MYATVRRMTRRQCLVQTSALTTFVLAESSALASNAQQPFALPPLPYAVDALEPHIDARTMEIHHDRHHRTYVDNLNKAVAGQATLANLSVEALIRKLDAVPEAIRGTVRNNGGGHLNHIILWQSLKKGGSRPRGELANAIDKSFGSFDEFRSRLSAASVGQFGSGWGWLCTDKAGALRVLSTANQDSPLTQGLLPLLGIDVWEHAYYLKYQNRRADYVAAIWNVVNWDFVSGRYAQRDRLLED